MRSCERPGCTRPHKAHGLCQSHYDRERGSHAEAQRRQHHQRLIVQRARQRATQALVRAHRDMFKELFQIELEAAQAQAQRIGDVLLRSGRTSEDQDEIDRIRLLEIACPACAAQHGAGEIVCVSCGQRKVTLVGVAS